jgi:hypothetical protein
MKTHRSLPIIATFASLLAIASPAMATQVVTLVPGEQGVWDTSTPASSYQSFYSGWEYLSSSPGLCLFPLRLQPSGLQIPPNTSGSSSAVWAAVNGYSQGTNDIEVVVLTTTSNNSTYYQSTTSYAGGLGSVPFLGNWGSSSGVYFPNGGEAVAFVQLTGSGTTLISVIGYAS